MSDANRTALRYITETTWNSLPGTPTMTPLRITGESLVPEVENITSQELRSDRMITDLIQVSRQNVGGFDYELSYGTFDTIMESAMFGAWSTNVLENGTTEKSFSIEKAHLDIDEYFLFTGCVVDSWTLNLATSSIATGSFNFLGSSATLSQSSNAASLAAASSTDVMNCMADVAQLQEATYGGTLTDLTGIYVQELSFTVNNNLRPIFAIGSNVIQDLGVGKMDLTGTMNCYFTSDRLFDKFLAGTAVQLQFQITDDTNTYTFFFPKVKFETESVVAPGQDQDVLENLTWRALRDASTGVQMRITRSG